MQYDSTKTRLLLWDEADVASRLADVLVAEPSPPADVDLDAVFGWLERRCRPGEQPEAVYFTTVPAGTEEARAAEVTRLRELGYEVHVRPVRADGAAPQMASSMLARIEQATSSGSIVEVVVASHDASSLVGGLEPLSGRGVTVTVLGFRERAGFAVDNPTLDFVDLEDVTGAFGGGLPRTNLYDLPSEGRALPPLRRRGTAAGAAPQGAAAPAPSAATAPWATSSVRPEASRPEPTHPEPARPEPARPEATRPDAVTAPEAPAPARPAEVEPIGSSLDDLLAGIRPAPLSSSAPPPPVRPGRVAPPNGSPS